MAMGIVSDNDFGKEINNTTPRAQKSIIPLNPSVNAEVIDIPSPGRKEGDVNVPNSLRQVIGESSFTDGRQEAVALASNFGISPSSVSAYARGAKSTASYDETPNNSIVASSRNRVQKRAMNRLMDAMKHITPDKLANAKARDLAGIAKDMSAVIKQMEPDSEPASAGQNQPQFLVYAPQFRDERSYEVIYAKE